MISMSLATVDLDASADKLTQSFSCSQTETNQIMDELIDGLHQIRTNLQKEAWAQWCENVARPHPIRELLMHDPFTRRSVLKPRGYSGDAELLDYIYRGIPLEEHETVSEIGRRLFKYTAGVSGSAQAVRYRCNMIVERIDAIAEKVSSPEILSVACGHLYEAELSQSFKTGKIARFVALDQDVVSLREVSQRYEDSGVSVFNTNIKNLVRENIDIGKFDLIYCSGLYDYVQQPIAKRLTEVLFSFLKPHGRLIIGNFIPNYRTAGYMEAFMDWTLICRNEVDMKDLSQGLEPARIDKEVVFRDTNDYIVYLDLAHQ